MPRNHTASQQDVEVLLPSWQSDLINRIFSAASHFYCLPEKLSGNNEMAFKSALVETFKGLNAGFPDESSYVDKPATPEQYKLFSEEINKTLHDFDSHLELDYRPEFIAEMKGNQKINYEAGKFDFGGGPSAEELVKWNQYEVDHPERNFGFINEPGRQLPLTIGYLKVSHLLDPQLGAEKDEFGAYKLPPECRMGPNAIDRLNHVMAEMQGKKGIVLDLSGTKFGGSLEMVQRIVSFFVKQKGLLLNEVDDRLAGERLQYRSVQTACDLFDMPVAIITDQETFSGREEIAYDLQQLNRYLQEIGEQQGDRFQIIGEITRGGAHPTGSFPLLNATAELDEELILWVPFARSINPFSKTNWEKVGVQPDIPLLEHQDALTVAVGHLSACIAKSYNATTKSDSKEKSQFGTTTFFAEKKVSIVHVKDQSLDISDAEMAASAFGQGSHTARRNR